MDLISTDRLGLALGLALRVVPLASADRSEAGLVAARQALAEWGAAPVHHPGLVLPYLRAE